MTHLNALSDPTSGFIDSPRAAAPREHYSTWSELPVLSASVLIERAGLERVIPLVRVRLGYPRDVFALAGWPLIAGFADFVQLLPVPGSKRYGALGGQLSRGLAMALRALDHRRGQILPRGVAPELIVEHAHRWTYAVFAAALLRDVDTMSAAARVSLERSDGSRELWDPMLGPMAARGAVRYRIEEYSDVGQPAAREPTLAARLFERSVPDAIRAWLRDDVRLLPELSAALADYGCPDNAIGELVLHASGSRSVAKASNPNSVDRAAAPPDASSDDGLNSANAHAPEIESLEAVHPEGSELALRFMRWLKEGIASGSLPVNEPDALVHGVDEGLLLASPRIFRKFAKHAGDMNGSGGGKPVPTGELVKQVQREVLRAGWHLRAEGGVNLICYEVLHNDRPPARVHGIVIRAPARFVNTVPPVNRALVRLVEGAAAPG